MNRSSKMSVTGVSKSGNPRSGKGRKVHMPNVIKTKTTQQIKKNISAQKIQRAWLSHMDKTIFQLLKHTICAAYHRLFQEHFVSYEILKKVSPLEAELVKDPSMKCKVRFRFSGETFPPFIVFKIFLQTEGHGYKYFSGKNLLKPSSEAVVDACKIMGKKKFYHQIMEDEHLFQKFKVTDEIDVVTLKDYMQYSSLLDETPASFGGRNNYWRRLNLKNIPKTMIIYDIVDYAESGIISNRLRKEMKHLLERPQTEEMRQHQLQIVSEIRCPSSFSSIQPLYQPYQQQSQIRHLGRRSKQAKMKVEKMRKASKMAKEKSASTGTVFSRTQQISGMFSFVLIQSEDIFLLTGILKMIDLPTLSLFYLHFVSPYCPLRVWLYAEVSVPIPYLP
uniref:Chromosome X CXorf58 homolog n=1 Tax=Equus caballus TaxID=9796 RepID=A0A9L0SGI3_HORSE